LPYIEGTKISILEDARDSITLLGLDFEIVFKNTNTSYNPDDVGRSSGKSGADVERILAFHTIGVEDPVQYTDGWEAALANAQFEQRKHEASS
jgi:7-cyano-7-deazaguanine synthase